MNFFLRRRRCVEISWSVLSQTSFWR
jgi:hypothetical protein